MTQTEIKAGKAEVSTLIQLHWQNPQDVQKTEMVAQGGNFKSTEEMFAWINRMIRKKRDQCPEGWSPMICDATSDYFVWAKR